MDNVKPNIEDLDRKNREVQFYIGCLHAEGDEMPQDFIKAAYWYRKSAHRHFSATSTTMATV